MKNAIPVLAVALIGTIGASSAAQAAFVDFGVTALGGTVTFAGGSTLDKSSSIDLDGSELIVAQVGAGDSSGLSVFPVGSDTVTIASDIMFGSGSGIINMGLGADSFEKTWVSGTDMFTEKLTTVKEIDRDTVNAITVTLVGTLTDTAGIFNSTPATLILSANEAHGLGGAMSVSMTDTSSTLTRSTSTPEPSTWVMMALGFAGLGYAAVRRRPKDRSALAI
jgi:hypothetical protein